MVIALTHMRVPNDELLTQSVPELDLVLGGHDHDYAYYCKRDEHGNQAQEAFMVKSGCDFRELSYIELKPHQEADPFHYTSFPLTIPCPSKGFTITCDRLEVCLVEKRDEAMKQLVFDLTKEEQKKLKEKIGYVGVDLNCVFSSIRREETNIANFYADMINYNSKTDFTIFNAGSLRIDEIISEGVITLKELKKLVPAYNPIIVFEGTGAQVLKLLENGVSKVPGLEGRFPCVSGL